MFGRKKEPGQEFQHGEGCKIAAADPSVSVPWSEVRRGTWEAVCVCVCGKQYFYEPVAGRVRVDPYDAATARHLAPCAYSDERDPRRAQDLAEGLGARRLLVGGVR